MRAGTTAPIGPIGSMATVGDERQIADENAAEATEREESIAEGMMSYKKLLNLQQGVSTLQKTSRNHHEMVVRLEKAMSDTISETDLRRAIGLALEEFDSQLVEAFRDSNRKCISMFAKSDEVAEMGAKMDKKVNFDQYNGLLQKLSELRKYIDTMAESVFIGHQESQQEFATEVNVDKKLKLKADLSELTQVRAKLERLEAVVTANDLKHNSLSDELREQVTKSNASNIQTNRKMIEQNKAEIATLKSGSVIIQKRVTEAEEHIDRLSEDTIKLTDIQSDMQERQDGVIWRACQSLQGLFQGMEGKVNDLNGELKTLRSNNEQFQEFVTKRVQQLFDDDEQVKEQVKFLMEASEMLKRRSREFNKTHTSQLKELKSSESKHADQMATLERSFKGHERDLRAIEKRIPHALSMLASAGDSLPPAEPVLLDPNNHLQGVLSQLERIANGQPGPQKWPLPMASDSFKGAEDSSALIPGLLAGLTGLPPGMARGAYGNSPRLPATSPRPPLPAGPGPGTQAPRRVPRSS